MEVDGSRSKSLAMSNGSRFVHFQREIIKIVGKREMEAVVGIRAIFLKNNRNV